MSAGPKATVVVPTYNMDLYLGTALDSVLAQTLEDFELLVIDNASTDGTAALMARYGDPRIRYLRNERNLGWPASVQRGCELAAGTFILFMGADDRLEPRFLEEAATFLDTEPTVAMVHGPAAWIDKDGRRFGGTGQAWKRITPGHEAMLGAFGDGFCLTTMLMRTATIQAIGKLEQRWQEVLDLWLFLRMCLVGDIGYLDQVWCEYRIHDQAMSMPAYRENLMFRRQMMAAREAFAWPEAIAAGAGGFRRAAERHSARIAMEVLHLSRAHGRKRLLRNLMEIVREVPEVLLQPRTWARAGFGLLPLGVIEHLRRARHRRALSQARAKPAP